MFDHLLPIHHGDNEMFGSAPLRPTGPTFQYAWIAAESSGSTADTGGIHPAGSRPPGPSLMIVPASTITEPGKNKSVRARYVAIRPPIPLARTDCNLLASRREQTDCTRAERGADAAHLDLPSRRA